MKINKLKVNGPRNAEASIKPCTLYFNTAISNNISAV
jgi:hypothetical protein